MLEILKGKAISINGKTEEASTVSVQRMSAGGKRAYDKMLKAQADSYVASVLMKQNGGKDVLTPNLSKRASLVCNTLQ